MHPAIAPPRRFRNLGLRAKAYSSLSCFRRPLLSYLLCVVAISAGEAAGAREVRAQEPANSGDESVPQTGEEAPLFTLEPTEARSGYEVRLEAQQLSVRAFDRAGRTAEREYPLADATSPGDWLTQEVPLAGGARALLLSQRETDLTFVFVDQDATSEQLSVRLALRGSLAERGLKLSFQGGRLLLHELEPKLVCGHERGSAQALAAELGRFVAVRRSPLSADELATEKTLAAVELPSTLSLRGVPWESAEYRSYSDGDVTSGSIDAFRLLELKRGDEDENFLVLTAWNTAAPLYLIAGAEVLRLTGDAQSPGGDAQRPASLTFELPPAECYALATGKAEVELGEIFWSTGQAASEDASAITSLVADFLAGKVENRSLLPKSEQVVERMLAIWPTLSSAEKGRALQWAWELAPQQGAALFAKALGEPSAGEKTAEWLRLGGERASLLLTLAFAEAPAGQRLVALERTMPVAPRESLTQMAEVVGRQPASVRAGFRQHLAKAVESKDLRETYFELADQLFEQGDSVESRRAQVEWLRAGANLPEIESELLARYLTQLGQARDFREAYVLVPGLVARAATSAAQQALAQTLSRAPQKKGAYEDWFRSYQSLKLTPLQRSALFDQIFLELIAHPVGDAFELPESPGRAEVRTIYAGEPTRNHAQEQALELFVEMARSALALPSAQVRARAAEWLGQAQTPGVVSKLVELAREDQWPNVRAAAVFALAQYPEGVQRETRFELFRRTLRRDDEMEVRRRAALALSHLPSEESEKLLLRTLKKDRHADVRAAAARSLGKLCSEAALPQLTEEAMRLMQGGLTGPDLHLALAALAALYRIDSADLKERLSDLDESRVAGPYQAGLRAAQATSPACQDPAAASAAAPAEGAEGAEDAAQSSPSATNEP